MSRVAILRYPGTWSERDFAHALSLVEGVETEIVWHEDLDLHGFDAAYAFEQDLGWRDRPALLAGLAG